MSENKDINSYASDTPELNSGNGTTRHTDEKENSTVSDGSILPNKQIFNHPDQHLSNPPDPSIISENKVIAQITHEEQLEKDAALKYQKSIEDPLSSLELERPTGILQFFHLPGILLLAVALGYFVGRFRLSYTAILVVCYALYFVFNRQMKKFRRSLVSTISLEQRRSKAKNNWESVEWMNYFFEKLWTVLEPKISKEIFKKVNPILGEKCPPFLNRLRLIEFTLGSKPPHITGISFHENVEDDIIQIDFEIGYIPLEIGKNLHSKIFKSKKFQWNSKIILVARLGTATKGIGIDLPIMVKNILFSAEGRIILKLTKELPLVKSIEFLFLSKPEIDFTLKPLKSVDIMDLPGLSNVIFSIIDSGLSKSLVNPNSIVIDLQKVEEEKVMPVGVLFMRVARGSNAKECVYGVQIDGRKMFYTGGSVDGVIEEYFYIILEVNDDLLEICMKTKNTESLVGDGAVKIKKLMLMHNFSENVKIFSKGDAKNLLSCNFSFFPLVKNVGKRRHPTNSAIMKLDILNAEDIQASGCSRSKVYSSFCTLSVGPKEEFIRKMKGKVPNPLNLVKGTAKLVGGAINTAGGLVAGALGIDAEGEEHAFPSTPTTFFYAKTRKILETNSPNFDESYKFFVRNIDTDFIYIFLWEESNSEWIGKVEIPIKDIQDKEEKYYKLKDAQNGRIKLKFNLFYVNEKDNAEEEIETKTEIIEDKPKENKYKRALRLTIKQVNTIHDNGIFYMVAKTNNNSFFIPNFSIGEFPITRVLILPITEEDNVQLYLFRKNIKDDEYIGKGVVVENGKVIEALDDSESIRGKEITTVEVDIFDNLEDVGSVFLEVEEEQLTEYKGVEMYKDNVKIIQININDSNIEDKYYIEFKNNKDIINTSRIIEDKKNSIEENNTAKDKYLFITGESDIKANIFSGILNSRNKIGECIIPKRSGEEQLYINKEKYIKIHSETYTCNFKLKENITRGIVSIKIKNCKNIKAVDSNGFSDPYIKIFLNGKKIYKTKVIKKQLNPIYNESTAFNTNIELDTLRIEIKDYNTLETNKLIGYKEFPLCFLNEGTIPLSLDMIDSQTHIKSNTTMELELSFRGNSYS